MNGMREFTKFLEERKQDDKSKSKTETFIWEDELASSPKSRQTEDKEMHISQEITITPRRNPKAKTREEVQYQFSDFLPKSGNFLQVIHHPLKFVLSIPHDPTLSHLSLQEKVRLLEDYRAKEHLVRRNLAMKSLHMAPTPKAIVAKSRVSHEEDPESMELYISRSGRQVKRKDYFEKLDPDQGVCPSSTSKKSKTRDVEVEKRKTPVVKKVAQLPRTQQLLKNASVEVEKEKKKKSVQDVMDTFGSITVEDDDDDVVFVDAARKVEADEDFVVKSPEVKNDVGVVRIRVVPPVPGKKKAKPIIDTALPRSTPVKKSTAGVWLCPKDQSKVVSKEISPENNVNCPICNKQFHADEIEHHAALCDFEEGVPEHVTADAPDTITCDLCDRAFRFPDFEGHTRECIASKVDQL